jgi:hypothetical protein
MLRFVCDYCGDIKQPEEVWINGVAAENVGTQAARREVIIDPAWRYERAISPLAVHFCSVECKDRYLTELFQTAPPLLEVEHTLVDPASNRRIIVARKKPAAVAVKKRITGSKKTRRR